MQQRYTSILILVLFFAASRVLIAQPGFTATVSPNVIGRNETAELKLLIENASSVDISLPSLQNFTVSSPVQKNFPVLDEKGIMHNYAGFVYVLKPKKTGVFIIGAVTAVLDGKKIKCNPVTLKVIDVKTNTTPAPGMDIKDVLGKATNFKDYILKKGENIKDKTSKNLFIKVSVNKISCYVGEPVIATYKLYTRLGNTSNIAKNPAFNGFSVIDLEEPEIGTSSRVEVLDGREYYVSTIRKAQLYPLQPGVFELGQAVIESKLWFTKEEFIAQFDENDKPEFVPGATIANACMDTTALISNQPLAVTVKPLPGNNKPVSFNGAVGNFMIDALIEKNSFTTDDAGKLKVLLSGEGNMTLVPAPEIKFPGGLEVYEPAVKDGLNRLVVPVSGSRIFDYTFTAAKEGDYTIAPISFSYFDIDSGKYKTISTKQITVHIARGTGKVPVIAAGKINQPESFAEKMFTHRWMIIGPVILLILTGLLVWLRADSKRQKEKLKAAALKEQLAEEEEQEDIIPVNPLQQSELLLLRNEPRPFYEVLDKELHYFLAHQLKLPAESISKKTILEALDRSGITVADSLAVQQLLDDIALQLYTPYADETKMQDYYVEAVRLVKIFKV